MGTMDRVYRFSSTFIDPNAETVWDGESGLASIPLGGTFSIQCVFVDTRDAADENLRARRLGVHIHFSK